MVTLDPKLRIERILDVLLCSLIKNDPGISESEKGEVRFKSLQDTHDEQLVTLKKTALSMLKKIERSGKTDPLFNITEDVIEEKFRKTREKIDQSRQEQKIALSPCRL